jgi:hypothetical protein
MRVDEAEAAQAQLTRAGATHVGQLELPGVAHDDVLDFAPPVEEHADLPSDVARDLGEVARKLRRAQLARLDAAAVGGEEPPGLARLQARRIAVQVVSRTVSSGATAALRVLACARQLCLRAEQAR